jgi:hypothetical protein
MSVLYITQPDAVINKAQEAFKIALKQEDGTWQKRSIPAQTVEQLAVLKQKLCPNKAKTGFITLFYQSRSKP